MMPPWPFILHLLATWAVWHIACVAQVRREERGRGVADDDRRFVSAMPGVWLFPLLFVLATYLIGEVVNPWGTWIIGAIHVVFFVVLLGSIAIDLWRIRNHT